KILLDTDAGTRPVTKNPVLDETMEKDLLNSQKDRSEHVMLVDLARNDLNRIIKSGSLTLNSFMEIRKFSHVMHLFSELSGELKDRQDTGNIIKACFPPGPVTGSPKIRAIEILDEIEKEGRGPYGGIVGLFGYDGAFDSTV